MKAIVYKPYELNLFKFKESIIHIPSDYIKLLQYPPISSIPLPIYYQNKHKNGIISTKESIALVENIKECSITEAASHFETSLDNFEYVDINKY